MSVDPLQDVLALQVSPEVLAALAAWVAPEVLAALAEPGGVHIEKLWAP